MNEALLTEVFTQPLLVESSYLHAYYLQLHNMMQGITAPEGYDYAAARKALQPYSVTSSSLVSVNSYTNLDDAPKNSIAVIQLKGPVIKNSQFCGPRGTLDIANDFNRAKSNPNIIGAVLDIESGGGMALAVKPLTDAILSFREEKYVIGLLGDVVASAGYYIAAYCDELIAQHPRAIIGSIGTMMAFADVTTMLEKQGIKFHEFYATLSTHKNKTMNEALKGNYAPVITGMLNPLNEDFHADVKEQREGRISLSDNLIFNGETYMAVVAKELGMIDSLGNMSDAVLRLEELSSAPRSGNKQVNNQHTHMKTTSILALAGVASPTQEQIDLANADLTSAGITGSTIVADSFITEAADVTAKNKVLNAELTQLKTDKGAVDASLVTANAKITELEGKVEAFGKNAGAAHKTAGGEDEVIDADKDEDPDKVIANLAHNKFAEDYY